MTFELLSKYSTEIGDKDVGVQQGLGTLKGFIRLTKVCTMAWLVGCSLSFEGMCIGHDSNMQHILQGR